MVFQFKDILIDYNSSIITLFLTLKFQLSSTISQDKEQLSSWMK